MTQHLVLLFLQICDRFFELVMHQLSNYSCILLVLLFIFRAHQLHHFLEIALDFRILLNRCELRLLASGKVQVHAGHSTLSGCSAPWLGWLIVNLQESFRETIAVGSVFPPILKQIRLVVLIKLHIRRSPWSDVFLTLIHVAAQFPLHDPLIFIAE